MSARAERNQRRDPPGRSRSAVVEDGWLTRLHEGILHRQAESSDRATPVPVGFDGVSRRRPRHVLAPWSWVGSVVGRGAARIADELRWFWSGIADGPASGWAWLVGRSTSPDGQGIALGTALFIALLSLTVTTSVVAVDRLWSEPADRTYPTTSGRDSGNEPNESAARASTPSESQPSGVSVHVNADAGYRFSYPDGWDLSSSGTKTAVLSPDGEVMMWFDVAPPGPLSHASERIVEDLTASHDDVRLVSDEVGRTPQGERSLVVGGEATDASGAPTTFLVITIQGNGQNRTILIHFGAESRLLDAAPGIREIVASFRTTRPE
jgi:hypothetical protein